MGGFISYCTHTSLGGLDLPVDVPFAFNLILTYLPVIGQQSPIFNFDMPDVWQTVPDS